MQLQPITPSAGWKWELAAVLTAVAGVAARCLPWRFVFTEAGVFFPGVDPYYHLWHARHLVEQFPHWSLMDPFLNFPLGAPFPYLKGFDVLVALPGLLGGGAESLATWGALMMPLWGGLAVYLTYRFGRAVFGPACGLVAAVLMAFLCGAMNYTVLGRVDHHAAVAPVMLSMFLCLLQSLRAGTRRRAVLWGCGCGLLAGWSVTLWVITPPIYYLPIPLTLVWLCFAGRGSAIRPAAIATTGTAALAVTVAAFLAGDLQSRPFELFLPSWIPVLLFALAALWTIAATYRPIWSLAVPGAAAGVLVLSLLGLVEIDLLARAGAVISERSTAFAEIIESQPLLWVDGQFSLQRAVAFYSNLFLLCPCLLGIFVYQLVRKPSRDPGRLLFCLFALLGGTLLLLQQRFGEYAAPAVSLLLAWALVTGGQHVVRYARQSSQRLRAGIFAAGLLVALAAAVVPIAEGLVHFAGTDTSARSRILALFGRQLSRTTPDPLGADGRLAYGLLSSEEDAVVLLEAARRPVMASSFGLEEIQSHNREAYRILLSDDEDWARGRLERLRIRYLVLSPVITRIEAMARVAGRAEEFVSIGRTLVRGKDVRITAVPRPPFFLCLHTRLFMGDGSQNKFGATGVPALSHFRLHLESEFATAVFGLRMPAFKAFEVVPGARLIGSAPPNTPVMLRLAVQANTGRTFTYSAETQAGDDGRFEFVVPYATTGERSSCRAEGPYRIKVGEQIYHLQVAEQAVMQGDTLTISEINRAGDTSPPSGADPPPAPPGE